MEVAQAIGSCCHLGPPRAGADLHRSSSSAPCIELRWVANPGCTTAFFEIDHQNRFFHFFDGDWEGRQVTTLASAFVRRRRTTDRDTERSRPAVQQLACSHPLDVGPRRRFEPGYGLISRQRGLHLGSIDVRKPRLIVRLPRLPRAARASNHPRKLTSFKKLGLLYRRTCYLRPQGPAFQPQPLIRPESRSEPGCGDPGSHAASPFRVEALHLFLPWYPDSAPWNIQVLYYTPVRVLARILRGTSTHA